MTSRPASTPSVRLLFEISRDDNPRLYDDLMRFNKGPKRVNRLRFLAYEGLLVQMGRVPGVDVATRGVEPVAGVDREAAAHTIGAFEVQGDTS